MGATNNGRITMKQEQTITFVDLLDPDRILVLVLAPNKSDRDKTVTVTARVYWNKNVAGKIVRVFGGTSEIPRHLLISGEEPRRGAPRPRRWEAQESQEERIGYMSEPGYQRKLERERSERQRHRDDE